MEDYDLWDSLQKHEIEILFHVTNYVRIALRNGYFARMKKKDLLSLAQIVVGGESRVESSEGSIPMKLDEIFTQEYQSKHV